ncbi:MAG: fused MFS/spermidine synthase [Gammaproteobacteria bacterium]|nr:fused MFS/spermidine synthase [Gammaproteobacteria bacterium]
MNSFTGQGRLSFAVFLVFTAVLCGALVMVIEVLGSRIVGPFFGVSLFVWTSLITVTLLALAIGYALGGWLSDRRPSPDYLYAIICIAGLLVLLVPLLQAQVLELCQPLGLRIGALSSTLLLFGPPLLLLGCVSPYLVKIAAQEFDQIGSTVGRFYAYSTLGSCIGTLVTGFVLITYLGVNRIFQLSGALLIVLSVAYFLMYRKFVPVAAALMLPYVLAAHPQPHTEVLPNGTKATLIASRDSFYGNIKVVDYSYERTRTRELLIDGLIQGGIDQVSGLSIYGYSYFLQYLPRTLNPGGTRCLVIGAGAGLIPRWYEDQGISTDVVDIDPVILTTAREYFGYSPRGDIFIQDARYFLTATSRKYDYMILDVFNGDTTPSHLMSLEAFRLMRARLADTGVLAMNLVVSLENRAFVTSSLLKTLREVFGTVLIYPGFEANQEDSFGNVAVIAYPGNARPVSMDKLNFPVHRLARSNVFPSILRAYEFESDEDAIILTDDYNPIDVLDSSVREGVRRNILSGTPWKILSFQ